MSESVRDVEHVGVTITKDNLEAYVLNLLSYKYPNKNITLTDVKWNGETDKSIVIDMFLYKDMASLEEYLKQIEDGVIDIDGNIR